MIEHKEDAYRSYELATIIRDVPLEGLEKTVTPLNTENLQKAIPFLKEYQLNSLSKRIQTTFSGADSPELEAVEEDEKGVKFQWILVENDAQFNEMLADFKQFDTIAFDTETTSTDSLTADLVGISLAAEPTKGYYISIKHQMADNLPVESTIKSLQQALRNKLLVAHNVKYDYQMLKRFGYKFDNPFFDTMIADYLINPTSRHSLADCSKREFEYDMIPIKSLIGTGKKQITFDLVPSTQAAEYSVEDVIVTIRLYPIYKEKLKELELDNLYNTIELPLFTTLSKMEENGVFIDVDFLNNLSKRNQKQLAELTNKIYEIAGSQFNLNSTQQLGKVLFEDLGIPPLKKTKSGYSTDITVLESLAKEHEIARLLMDYRQITKMESTYIKALPVLINPATNPPASPNAAKPRNTVNT